MSGASLLLVCFFLVALWEVVRPRRKLDGAVCPRWLGNLAVYFINGALFVWLFPAPSDMAARIESSLGLGLPQCPQSLVPANFGIGSLPPTGRFREQHMTPCNSACGSSGTRASRECCCCRCLFDRQLLVGMAQRSLKAGARPQRMRLIPVHDPAQGAPL